MLLTLRLSRQCGSENSAGVKVSGASSKLLRHAAEEDAAQQEAHVWGDWSQAKGSGTFQRSPWGHSPKFPSHTEAITWPHRAHTASVGENTPKTDVTAELTAANIACSDGSSRNHGQRCNDFFRRCDAAARRVFSTFSGNTGWLNLSV